MQHGACGAARYRCTSKRRPVSTIAHDVSLSSTEETLDTSRCIPNQWGHCGGLAPNAWILEIPPCCTCPTPGQRCEKALDGLCPCVPCAFWVGQFSGRQHKHRGLKPQRLKLKASSDITLLASGSPSHLMNSTKKYIGSGPTDR